MQADIHDHAVFAAEIRHDRYRPHAGRPAADRPARQGRPARVRRELRPGRGAGILLLARRSTAVLAAGTKQLQAAGFGARSGWLTSSTFGGISWLAHSTMQSGLWIDNPSRYDQLVASNRLTLSTAFKRAGWRTVADVPSDNRYWPEGSSFYHYDKVYDRLQRRIPRPDVRLCLDARPVRLPGPAAPRAGQDRPPAAVRRGRPGVEPRAVDAGPAADRVEPRRRRLDLLQAAGRHERPDRRPLGWATGTRSSTR